ncbi:MAG: HEAT repeat domain-containing protein [Pirellulales bacterium]
MQNLLKPRGSFVARFLAIAACAANGAFLFATPVEAKEAEWIWSPAYEKETAQKGDCFFRKTFNLGVPEHGEVQIACDDSYELYVNGRHLGGGSNWKVLDVYDITKYLVQGINTVAVKAVNSEDGSAGLVARVVVQERGNTHVEHSTDDTWKTALKEFAQWPNSRFDDARWLKAKSFGALNATLPWGNEVTVGDSDGRFRVTPEFHVEWVVDPKQTGSLICMTFDEFGQIIASRENGPLVIVRDDDRDGLVDTASTYCDKLKNCQGLLAVSGKVYAVGQGPQGAALYRLSDEDQDGRVDRLEAILKFSGEMGEHGPHALVLGPDGLLYLILGNFTQLERKFDASSPYHDFYEGDLLTPRYEDAAGHAVGIKAPGGTIIRTDTSASAVEAFAGGLQNPYDLVFNQQGELFTCDSDMEWDSGMPWYRPTRLNHVTAGSEFGWRSGWSKWPNYYVDSLPPAMELGRGSPAGMEVYDHYMYPVRYHNALFVCDWSRGRILAVRARPHGSTFKATAEVFLEGQPLNATDIAVGPDGWLYFCTGGRDTEGGIYRVVWDGKVPPDVRNREKGLAAAIKQPQLASAWARQRIVMTKQQLGDDWGKQLTAFVENQTNRTQERARALDLMQLFGPYPSTSLLITASRDRAPLLRAKAAYLMGIHVDRAARARLVELLEDKDLSVNRAAAEALVRSGETLPVDALVPLLASTDRHVAWSAARALQQMPRDHWETAVVEHEEPRVFVVGSTALLGTSPPRKTVDQILTRSRSMLGGYLTDNDFLGLLRVMQLALIKGEIAPDDAEKLRAKLSAEYPSQDDRMNRELVRMLVYLQEPTMAQRMVEQLDSDLPNVEKMQILTHAPFLKSGWTVRLKRKMLGEYENARSIEGGHSFAGYVENVSRDFFATFNDEERRIVLADGVKWPTSALSVLAKLPKNPSAETLAEVERLDRQVKRLDTEAAKRLRIGICAVLGASKDPLAMAYLRELYETEPDRRVHIAIGLAQKPDGENWPYLIRSLAIVEGAAAQEVLMRLGQVDRSPDVKDAETYRQVILRGLSLRENGSRRAVELLEKWTAEQLTAPDDPWDRALAAWQQWFTTKYPDMPEASLPVENEQNNWTYQELLSFLTGPQASEGVAARGEVIFEKAQCIKCHRYGSRGDTIGPDLTNVNKRFQTKEILESILFPSQVISDQYASQTVVTTDGKTYSGLVAPSGDGSLVVLQATGEKVTVPEAEVDEATRNKTSGMPEGLLNTLTLDEIADLFAYLASPPRHDVVRRPLRR